MRAVLKDVIRLLDSIEPDTSCHTCHNLMIGLGGLKTCNAWCAPVPDEALAVGCEQWQETEEGF